MHRYLRIFVVYNLFSVLRSQFYENNIIIYYSHNVMELCPANYCMKVEQKQLVFFCAVTLTFRSVYKLLQSWYKDI